MILPKLGRLSTDQAIGSATAEDSENVIYLGTDEDVPDDLWLEIVNKVTVSGTGALTIDLILSTVSTLDTSTVKVMSIVIASEADKRIATAGAHVLGCTLPREVRELAKALSYDYLGLIYTPTSTLALTLDAAISMSKPRTKDAAQVTRSNVGVPTA